MKKYIYTTLVAMAGAAAMNAQSAYDAEIMSTADLNGTARYVGMGGALGALGADLSTMGNNPAGTGLMRTQDISFSFGGLFTGNKGTLGEDGGRASVDQAGIVFVLPGDNGSLRNINFGVNYQKKRNYMSNLDQWMNLNGGSQTFQIAEMADDAYLNNTAGALTYGAIPYATKMGKTDPGVDVTDVRNNVMDSKYYHQGIILDNYKEIMVGSTPLKYADYETKFDAYDRGKLAGYGYFGIPADEANIRKATFGSNAQIDLNVSTNLDDRVFLGLSVGVYTSSYDRYTAYYEKGIDGKTYQIDSKYHNSADGVNVKFGAIFRPVEDSPFRFGIAVHTPTWYNIRDYNTVYIGETDYTFDSGDYKYRFRTPWKFNFSIGHTISNMLALGVEYEFQDLASNKYSSSYGSNLDMSGCNNDVKANLRTQHTVKVGAELKPAPEWAIRLGYNLVTSGIKKTANTYINYNSDFTETDYTNWGAINRITFGLGYRFRGGYIDLAYQLQLQKGDLYAYDYNGVDHREVGLNYNPVIAPTQITNNRSHVMATLGFKF